MNKMNSKNKDTQKESNRIDTFETKKKSRLDAIYKSDKSKTYDVDKVIIPLMNYLNTLCDYYTTNSCSGRIQIVAESSKKTYTKPIHISHEKISLKNIESALSEIKINHPEDKIWLRQENTILRVACKNIIAANKIVKIAQEIGLKHNIIDTDPTSIIIEVFSGEKMDVPIIEKGKLLFDEKNIRSITTIANKKFLRGREKLLLLESEIKSKIR